MDFASLKSAWTSMEVDRPMDLVERRRVMGEKIMVSHVTLEEGFVVPPHHHENEQITIVVEGRLRFRLGETEEAPETMEVATGEVLHLPSMLWHGAEALERTVVLDLFAPPSEGTGIDEAGVEGEATS